MMNNKFPARKGNFCLLINLVNSLVYRGISIGENYLSALVSYMGFSYFEGTLPSGEIIHGRFGTIFDIFNRFLNLLPPGVISEDTMEFEEFYSCRSESEHQKEFPLLWADIFYIKDSEYFQKAHYWNLLVILGFKNESVFVFNNGMQSIDIDIFRKAVYNLGEFSFFYFEDPGLIDWFDKKKLITGLTTTTEQMKTVKKTSDCFLSGFHGMDCFVNDFSKGKMKDKYFNLYYQLSRPGGLKVSREGFSNFLREVNNVYQSPIIENTAVHYKEISTQWRIIANLLFKLNSCAESNLFNRIRKRMENILVMEKSGVGLIEEVIMFLQSW